MNNTRLLFALTALSVMCSLTTVKAAFVTISIDGESSEVPVYPTYEDGYLEYIMGYGPNDPYVYETPEGKITIGGELDPDPSLLFGSVALDFGAPSSFSYMFMLPLSPAYPNPSRVSDSFSGSVTNGSAAGGVTVTALPPPVGIPTDGDGVTEMQVYTLSDNGGATWKNVGLDLGPSATIPLAPFGSGLYGNFNTGQFPTIAGGPWTNMRADVNFMLSGGGDTFTFNGAKELVPEPGVGILVITLLGAMSGHIRRRRS